MRLIQSCLAVAVISLLAQHAHSAEPASKSLIGKWNLDTAAMLKQMEDNAKTDEEKQALAFAKPLMSSMKMQMEFTADGVMAVSMNAFGKDETKKGTFKVKSEMKDSLVVLGTMDNDTKEVQMSFPKADVMQVTIPEDNSPLKTMLFKRVKEEASN